MKNELFYELQESIKEGGKILKCKRKPGREFFSAVTVHSVSKQKPERKRK